MWPRVIEIMLGLWLMLSPFIFHYASHISMAWISDLVCGFLIIAFGMISYVRTFRWVHFLTIFLAIYLIIFGYLKLFYVFQPAAQNHILVGLLLLLFAILPNHVNSTPDKWDAFYHELSQKDYKKSPR